MNLTTAVIYYIGMFFATGLCIVSGCLLGAKLRKQKNAKSEHI